MFSLLYEAKKTGGFFRAGLLRQSSFRDKQRFKNTFLVLVCFKSAIGSELFCLKRGGARERGSLRAHKEGVGTGILGGSVPPALKSRANLGGDHICKTDYR